MESEESLFPLPKADAGPRPFGPRERAELAGWMRKSTMKEIEDYRKLSPEGLAAVIQNFGTSDAEEIKRATSSSIRGNGGKEQAMAILQTSIEVIDEVLATESDPEIIKVLNARKARCKELLTATESVV